MVQTCGKCARANPREAVYCHFDGSTLAGHVRIGGPLTVGSQLFPTPFVFTNKQVCRNFDELALACQKQWVDARAALSSGRLESFLANLGRLDLASAARESSRYPDPDRGLDQLLLQLPTGVLDPPVLRLEPQAVSLGVLGVGEPGAFDLHLENQGMRLLHGSVRCTEGVWLALGEAPGVAEKHFQFTQEMTVPVRVRSDRLRATSRPVEGRLLVESNGGSAEVVVRAEVPPLRFPDGVLAGACTPRQVAEKARGHPREAAALFESGAVAAWYRSNGWKYPVPGPSASGLGAVQQFFEALGLTPAPRVHLSEQSVSITGEPGQTVSHTLELRGDDKRPVYAHACSNAPWLEVGRAGHNGRSVTIRLTVPSVPYNPGAILTADVTVLTNGNQRMVVPVSLTVSGGVSPPFHFSPRANRDGEVVRAPASRIAARTTAAPIYFGRSSIWKHAVPAAALLIVLLVLIAVDALTPAGTGPGGEAQGDAGIGYRFGGLIDPEPRLDFLPHPSHNLRFGLVLLRERDPKYPEKHKRLTYEECGGSNNTCVKVDGAEHTFGRKPGRLVAEQTDKRRNAWSAAWEYDSGVRVTQTVQIVPGAQTGLLDTCLVRYTVRNRDRDAHTVGLRVLFDTFIGAEDGVPFVLSGYEGLLRRPTVFNQKQIPEHLQALENPDPALPGTVACMGLKNLHLPGEAPEPIVRMVVGTWPHSEAKWEWEEPREGQDIQDSAVTLYWDYRRTEAGETRDMAFSYGLNAISPVPAGFEGTLALTVGGSFEAGNVFTVTALVKRPKPGQAVRLTLPDEGGVAFAPGEMSEKHTPEEGAITQVSWRVVSSREGVYTLAADSGSARVSFRVRIANRGLFR